MWPVDGLPVSVDFLAGLKPANVLYEYEGPRIFSCPDQEGKLLLVYECDHDEETTRYLVVPTCRSTLDELIAGRCAVRQALQQPRSWIVDVRAGAISEAWSVEMEKLPAGVLPKAGTRLWARHGVAARLPPDCREKVRRAEAEIRQQGGLWPSLRAA